MLAAPTARGPLAEQNAEVVIGFSCVDSTYIDSTYGPTDIPNIHICLSTCLLISDIHTPDKNKDVQLMLTVSNRLEEITVREGASNMAADSLTLKLLPCYS